MTEALLTVEELVGLMPHAVAMGIRLEGATAAEVRGSVDWALFFRAVRSGAAHATSRPLHVGQSFIVVQTDLTDDSGKPVGQTTQTQAGLQAAGRAQAGSLTPSRNSIA